MVCEGILNICGTSSQEIKEKAINETKAVYIPQIEQLNEEKSRLLAENSDLMAEIEDLKARLALK